MVFFDLPVTTAVQRKNYRLFRKFLIKDGYLMAQESVYSKLVIDGAAAESAISRLRKNRPPQGLVQVLKITEKQYANIIEIVGEKNRSGAVDSTDRLVIL